MIHGQNTPVGAVVDERAPGGSVCVAAFVRFAGGVMLEVGFINLTARSKL